MTKLNVRFLKGFKSVIGLIGQNIATPVYLETRFGIHTFFLKFPIDVLILDKSNKVVKIKKGLNPNKIFVWNTKYYKVIELPSGEIGKLKIKIGDKIKLQYK